MAQKRNAALMVFDPDAGRAGFYVEELAGQGYDVTLTTSLAALKAADMGGTSAAVVSMSDDDGLSAIRALRRAQAGVGIIALCPDVTDAVVDDASRAGADMCLGLDQAPAKAISKALTVAETSRTSRVKANDLQEDLNGIRAQLEKVGLIDALSGAYNHRFLDLRLVEEVQRARRHQRSLSVVVLDLDDYKAYRDTNGSRLAEFLVRQTVALLRWGTRPSDCICRIEVDKFVVILPETPMSGAISVAEKVRRSLEDVRFRGKGDRPGTVTCSVGVAELTDKMEEPNKLLDAAEGALSDAKLLGKNTVRW